MMKTGELWSQMGSLMATLVFLYTVFERFFPPLLRDSFLAYAHKFTNHFNPYVQITFPEFSGENLKRSEAYSAIRTYLSANSSKRARRLKAEEMVDSQNPLVFSMDDNEEITEAFQGVKVWWSARKISTNPQRYNPFSYGTSSEKRYYLLTFHKRYRDIITKSYLKHVLEEGKEIKMRNRQLKLYTNNPSNGWYGYKQSKWNHIVFEHPATFETLAMDQEKKQDIIKDLGKFRKGKSYYAKIGKAWKRGYLLYGPPGTGKSTMIAAIANFMNYDLYDLELTAVKDNTELRRLLIETPSKSIIVIEDIDCSLDLTGQRKQRKEESEDEESMGSYRRNEDESNMSGKVTLSGLLNFIDGIWSACGGERIIIFTTNYVEKLDPALIRRGRMDKHIEMSYCGYEAFKVLAKNYLEIESHNLFGRIGKLLEEIDMSPADVAENLMSKFDEEDVETCLKKLIKAMEAAKEEKSRKKAEEESTRVEAKTKEKDGKENGFH